jgi:hypothetical protein
MENIPHREKLHSSSELVTVQTKLPMMLVRRVKSIAAENGATLQEIMREALEQLVAKYGKAA